MDAVSCCIGCPRERLLIITLTELIRWIEMCGDRIGNDLATSFLRIRSSYTFGGHFPLFGLALAKAYSLVLLDRDAIFHHAASMRTSDGCGSMSHVGGNVEKATQSTHSQYPAQLAVPILYRSLIDFLASP